jgi:hypothetical protein
VTNVSVLRLAESAWVHFKGPSDSGGTPIVSYTVHAQSETMDDETMVSAHYYIMLYSDSFNLYCLIACGWSKGDSQR